MRTTLSAAVLGLVALGVIGCRTNSGTDTVAAGKGPGRVLARIPAAASNSAAPSW